VTRTSLTQLIHQALGWALALLIGSTPLASLLAIPSEPECQMACCARNHHSGSCPRHPSADSNAPPIHFEASVGCPQSCACDGLAPSASDHVLVSPWATIRLTSAADCEIFFNALSAPRSALDPSLYQRPPPLPV
jgi:hypothetical protein